MADIVINGCLADPGCLDIPPKLDPFTCISTYCAKFPTTAIKITGNYHGMDTPLYDKVNATQTSDVAWGAYLGIAMIGADISDNSCTGGGCEEEPTGTDAGEPPPLVVGGTNRQLFVARDVRVSGNTGFQGSPGGYYSTRPKPGHTIGDPWPGAGWLRLLGDDRQPWMESTAVTTSAPATSPIRGCMNYHTWTADRVRVRNLIKRPDWQHPTAADAGGAVPSISTTNVTIDGDAVVEWSQTAGAASILLGQLDLAANPSVANHSVFLALDTRLIFNGTLELLIDGGDGVWHSSGTGTEPMHISTTPEVDAVWQCGDAPQGSQLWAVSSFQLQMASAGTARFGLRLSGIKSGGKSGPALQIRKVGAAVVGVGWERMWAEPAEGTCSSDETQEQLHSLTRELAELRAELRKATGSAPIKTDDASTKTTTRRPDTVAIGGGRDSKVNWWLQDRTDNQGSEFVAHHSQAATGIIPCFATWEMYDDGTSWPDMSTFTGKW